MVNPHELKPGYLVNHSEYGRCRVLKVVFDETAFQGIALEPLDDTGRSVLASSTSLALNPATGQFEKVNVMALVEEDCNLMDAIATPYEIFYEEKGDMCIRCYTCGKKSYNTYDIQQKYCGFCHKFHEQL